MILKTYQDFLQAASVEAFVQEAINSHKASQAWLTAVDADLYDAQMNPGIDRFYRAYSDMQKRAGNTSTDAKPEAIKCNTFNRLNTQRCNYLLGNGAIFEDEKIKAALGADFDYRLKEAGYKALIHGMSFGFWDNGRLVVFPLTECVPLWDECTGSLRACIRFWQLEPDRPTYAVLYEEDGYTKFHSTSIGQRTPLVVGQEKRPYKQIIIHTAAGGDEVVGEENYTGLPVIPFYGSAKKLSTLVGIRTQIDNYDLVLSGFASDVQECAQIYWLVENYGGMKDSDLRAFLDKINRQHIASVSTDGTDAKLQPYTTEVPTEARKALLEMLHNQMYEDFGGLDVHCVEAGSTNDHLNAAYQPLDEQADEFEYQALQFIGQLLKVAGLPDSVPTFKRNKICNQKEQTEMVMQAQSILPTEVLVKHLPWITVDEIPEILDGLDEAKEATEKTDEPEEDSSTTTEGGEGE